MCIDNDDAMKPEDVRCNDDDDSSEGQDEVVMYNDDDDEWRHDGFITMDGCARDGQMRSWLIRRSEGKQCGGNVCAY